MRSLYLLPFLFFAMCASPEPETAAPEWAIAIHGGAGVISKDLPDSVRLDYEASLTAALEAGKTMLADGQASLDVVEAVVRILEEDPRFNAGRGAVYTADGVHELDAAIMDGRDLSCGAVAGVTTVRNPITLARKVMTDTPHVFLIGAGAEAFADQVGVERVPNSFFDTEHRREALQRAKEQEAAGHQASLNSRYGTVGAVALDKAGNLAAATSTGGMTNKRFGRVGDVPVIGAGTYANNATAAISATGTGEEFIRHAVAHQISAQMEFGGKTLAQAAEFVVFHKLKPGDGGIISVSKTGEIAMMFNSEGMFRGAADSNGRFEVAIWE
jgi:beta-aspartyl-peptidase (threonine type)